MGGRVVALVALTLTAACAISVGTRADAAVTTTVGSGYRVAVADGTVYAFDAHRAVSTSAGRHNGFVVGIASTPSGRGYWLAASDGGVFTYGDARFYGSAAPARLRRPIVGIASTPSGRGYWLAAADGGVFAFGDARFRGAATRAPLRRPVVGIASTPSGRGYWLAAADGGVFAFGDAHYYGSASRTALTDPIVGIAATSRGYLLTGADGGVFAFGNAQFHGSAVAPLPASTVEAEGTPYRVGSAGYDISWPQCGAPLPPHGEIPIVGVNNGRSYTRNPCLAEEAAWAGRSPSLYVNVDGLPTDATSGLRGPRGVCAVGDLVCRSYNYGRNAVTFDLAYTKRLGVRASTWWLDVEMEPGWRAGAETISNVYVIQGVLDGLRAHGSTVGIYSTQFQWDQITGGGYMPRTPIWVAGATNLAQAQALCAPDHAFGGGHTLLSQWTVIFDNDVAC